MSARRLLLGTSAVLTAILLQTVVLTRLPLPGATADLPLVLVMAYALAEGPLSGMVTGFLAGLVSDSLADHAFGRLALTYAVVGYLAGFVQDETERSTLVPFLTVAGGAAGAVLIFAGEGILLSDPRVSLYSVVRSMASSVPYAVVLTPFVVPVVVALVRRVSPEPARR